MTKHFVTMIAAAVMGGVAYSAAAQDATSTNLLADVFTGQTVGQFPSAPWSYVTTSGQDRNWPEMGTVRNSNGEASGTASMLLLRWMSEPDGLSNGVTVIEVPNLKAFHKYTFSFVSGAWNTNTERKLAASFANSKVWAAPDAQTYEYVIKQSNASSGVNRFNATKQTYTFNYLSGLEGTYYLRIKNVSTMNHNDIIPITDLKLYDEGEDIEAALNYFNTAKKAAEDFLAKYPDASALTRNVILNTIPAAAPATIAECVAAVEAINAKLNDASVRRAIIESNAVAGGRENVVDMSDLIKNPNAEVENTDWTAFADGGAKVEYLRSEPPTMADGTTFPYFNPANWGGSDWTISVQQVVSVPAGRYRVSMLGRGSDALNWSRFVASTTNPDNARLYEPNGSAYADIPHISSTGGEFGRGWNMAYTDVEVKDENGTICISFQSSAKSQHQWSGFTHVQLVQLKAYSNEEIALEKYNAAKTAAENFLGQYPDALPEYLEQISSLIPAVLPATAAEINAITEALNAKLADVKLRRTIIESNALAEGLGAVNMTNLISDPCADATTANSDWNLVKNGSTNFEGVKGGESPELADGTTIPHYFDGWAGDTWTVTMDQTITLPAGKYRISMLARAQDSNIKWFRLCETTTGTIQDSHGQDNTDANHTDVKGIGAAGGEFGRGWNMYTLTFEVTENDAAVNFGVQARGTNSWFGFTDFQLVQIEKYTVALPDLLVNGETHTDGTITNENDVEITFDIPEGTTVFYKWEPTPAVEAFANEADYEGFTEYTGEPVKLSFTGKLSYYAQKGNLRSDIKTLDVSVTTGIENVSIAADEAAEYYNLNGVRVDASNLAKGIYVKRTTKGATKVIVK